MEAVVEHNGEQYIVKQGEKVLLEELGLKEGDTFTFSNVLLITNDKDDIKVGQPTINGASVDAKVLGETKAKKLRFMKYKRRKKYRRTIGHRQRYTLLQINTIKVAS